MIIYVSGIKKDLSLRYWLSVLNRWSSDFFSEVYPAIPEGADFSPEEYVDLIEKVENDVSQYDLGFDTKALGSRFYHDFDGELCSYPIIAFFID